MEDRMSQKGMRGSWTKYGYSRKTVIQAHITKIWACQSCGFKYPDIISPFLFEFIKGEYIRVCALCISNGCEDFMRRKESM